eukprot:scaffold27250_cov21-Tisochrysis_lutea.AAC.1
MLGTPIRSAALILGHASQIASGMPHRSLAVMLGMPHKSPVPCSGILYRSSAVVLDHASKVTGGKPHIIQARHTSIRTDIQTL